MLVIFTLVLNGMPLIKQHLAIFEQLALDWQWIIVHGTAQNNGSTAWCRPQEPGLGIDGTTQYLASIKEHPRVAVIENKLWPSKDAMCNAALERVTKPGVLIQADADEVWAASQLQTIVHLFEQHAHLSSIMFACRYWVGPKLLLQGQHCYGDYSYEWLRAWRFDLGQRFSSHEPPVLTGDDPNRRMGKEESRKLGLVFDHYSYATEAQAEYKEWFYGYPGLVRQWRALQSYNNFPVPLARFFPHVADDDPRVVRV